MSDYYERDYIEPETAYTLKEASAEVKISFSAEAMERATSEILNRYIEVNFTSKLEIELGRHLELKYHSTFTDLIEKIIREKFEERYPDLVINKVDEIAEYLKKLPPEKVRDWKYSSTGDNIATLAKRKVDDYIENELKGEIKKTTEYLEQFSRNYFANNLFRAMGMMDKMIPEAVPFNKE